MSEAQKVHIGEGRGRTGSRIMVSLPSKRLQHTRHPPSTPAHSLPSPLTGIGPFERGHFRSGIGILISIPSKRFQHTQHAPHPTLTFQEDRLHKSITPMISSTYRLSLAGISILLITRAAGEDQEGPFTLSQIFPRHIYLGGISIPPSLIRRGLYNGLGNVPQIDWIRRQDGPKVVVENECPLTKDFLGHNHGLKA